MTAGVEPTSAAAGVPVRPPVDALMAAQAGCSAIANVNVSPSASLAVGVNAYAYGSSCITNVGGEPLIAGGVFAGDSGDLFELEADSPLSLHAQSMIAPEKHAIASHCTYGRDLGIWLLWMAGMGLFPEVHHMYIDNPATSANQPG